MTPDELEAALTPPVAFVLSGGAGLGALHVGMLRGLATTGVEPALVVGTSVGALNGAVLAAAGSVADGAERLVGIWRSLRRHDVFPGGLTSQVLSLARNGHLFPDSGLRRLVARSLTTERIEDLPLPFVAVAAEALTGHVHLFESGPILDALLASTAIPLVFPPAEVGGTLFEDGGTVTNVPMGPAVALGAGSLVVLDAGNVCHLSEPPGGLADRVLLAVHRALQQRAFIEAPMLARRLPVLYLPRPCVEDWSPLDLERGAGLVDTAEAEVLSFLEEKPAPAVGAMVGGPHTHGGQAFVPAVLKALDR